MMSKKTTTTRRRAIAIAAIVVLGYAAYRGAAYLWERHFAEIRVEWEWTGCGGNSKMTGTIKGSTLTVHSGIECDQEWQYGNNICGRGTIRYYGRTITNVVIDGGAESIGNFMFSGCGGITSVTIGEGVTKIGQYAFYECGLKTVTLPNSLTSIGLSAFSKSGLTSVTIPGGVTEWGSDAFGYCADLASVTFSEGLTVIGRGAFRDCVSLTRVDIPNSVKRLEADAFVGCSNLKTVSIGSGLETIHGLNLFDGCSSLVSIEVSADHPSFYSLGGVWFAKIRWPVFKDNTKTYSEEKEAAYYYWRNSPDIIRIDTTSYLFAYPPGRPGAYVIPDGVTHIGRTAFHDNHKITSLTFPAGVTHIDYQAVVSCHNLDTIISLNPIPPKIGSGGEWGHTVGFANLPKVPCLYVPDNSISAYQNAAGWNVKNPSYLTHIFTCIKPLSELSHVPTHESINKQGGG